MADLTESSKTIKRGGQDNMLKDRKYYEVLQRMGAYSSWLGLVIVDIDKMRGLFPKYGFKKLQSGLALRSLKIVRKKTDKDFGNLCNELTLLLERTYLDQDDDRYITDELFVDKCQDVIHMIEPLFVKGLDRYSSVQAIFQEVKGKDLLYMKRRK